MSGLRIVLGRLGHVDCREVFLPGWESLGPEAMLRREVVFQGSRVALGEIASASGSADGTAVLEGEWRLADGVGAGLAGGRVEVAGGVGSWAGAGQAGGVLVVRGDAMDHLGAAWPGRKRGMTGGEIVVLGRVGDGAGQAMRRGVVAIGGDAGRGMGYSMLAGTVVALGAVGPDAGMLNKRGSLIALGDIAIAPSYVLACTYQPAFLPVILRRLRREYGLAVTDEQMRGPWRRWSGDFAELGRGEILTREMT